METHCQTPDSVVANAFASVVLPIPVEAWAKMIWPGLSLARSAATTPVRGMQSAGSGSGVSMKVSDPDAIAARARSDGSNSSAVRMNASKPGRATSVALAASVACR